MLQTQHHNTYSDQKEHNGEEGLQLPQPEKCTEVAQHTAQGLSKPLRGKPKSCVGMM